MYYLSGGLLHQNKFSVKFIGPNLFFPWLLVFYYLTDAFVIDLLTSSTSHPHPIYRSTRSQMLFKIGVLKNFAKFHRKAPGLESLFNNVFLQNTSGGCFMLLFMFFLLLLPCRTPLLPYSTVTFFV